MDYQINSRIVPLTIDSKLSEGDIIILFDKEKGYDYHLIIELVDSDFILAKKMASKGLPLKMDDRQQLKIPRESFNHNNHYKILDETNDNHLWPNSVESAITKLITLYSGQELNLMKLMNWVDFSERYNGFGGLSMWIRNYFGLYRGNFDLASNCNIEEPSADNVSSIIVYYFWEHITKTE